jgi:hypothetical protein
MMKNRLKIRFVFLDHPNIKLPYNFFELIRFFPNLCGLFHRSSWFLGYLTILCLSIVFLIFWTTHSKSIRNRISTLTTTYIARDDACSLTILYTCMCKVKTLNRIRTFYFPSNIPVRPAVGGIYIFVDTAERVSGYGRLRRYIHIISKGNN